MELPAGCRSTAVLISGWERAQTQLQVSLIRWISWLQTADLSGRRGGEGSFNFPENPARSFITMFLQKLSD